MELSLEDLFAEPPPKVIDNEVSPDRSTCFENVEGAHADFHNDKSIEQESRDVEAEKNNEQKLKKYHVPKLEDILGLPPSHTNRKSEQSFDNNYEYSKETNKEKPNGIYNSNMRELNETKEIGETFKDQFKQKSPLICRTPSSCYGGTFKRKPERDGSGSTNMNHEAIAAENIAQGAGQPVSRKRKAGNYQRKLHTKCRVGAKEIRKLVDEEGQDNCDFFGEMSNNSVERPQAVGFDNYESPHLYNIFNAGSKFFSQMTDRNAKVKTRKQKSKKKKKYKKGKYEKDEVKESVMYDNDGAIYKDDNILPPKQDQKPHKWPVCKQTSRTENEARSMNELNDVYVSEENINGKIHKGKRVDIQNSVLDSILKDASCFTVEVNRKDSTIGEVNIGNSSSISDSKNISSDKGGNEDAHLKDGCGPEVSVVKWYEETNQRTPVLNIGGTKVDDKLAIRGKDERAIIYKNQKVSDRSDTYGGKKSSKNFDDDDDDNNDDDDDDDDDVDDVDGGKSINDDGYNNEAKHYKNSTNAQNRKTQIHAARNHNGSLLSNVTDLPVDLSIVGQAAQQLLSVRRKRGGRKKKSKKKQRFNVKSKLRIDAKEVKAQCKFFLEGKCSKGAGCQFIHEGVPRRRELCRYYVTDSCLADECIFMHSEFPCKFFHAFSKCANGSTCKFSHEPLNEETRKLLDELLARDANLKTERTTQPSEEQDTPVTQLPCDKDTEQTSLSLYSSLI